MPFGYFGAKHGMARFYPTPQYRVVVEPFAGSAAYACYHARMGNIDHAILVDKNPHVIALWKRLQSMSPRDIDDIPVPVAGERTAEPLIAAASGEQMMAVLRGKSRQVTTRMVKGFQPDGYLRRRIRETVSFIRHWDIILGDYNDLENMAATWFIDPPYQVHEHKSRAGASYKEYADINYDRLAEWCKSRQGQVVVCEQHPSSWLPFQTFRRLRNGVGRGTSTTNTELVWTN